MNSEAAAAADTALSTASLSGRQTPSGHSASGDTREAERQARGTPGTEFRPKGLGSAAGVGDSGHRISTHRRPLISMFTGLVEGQGTVSALQPQPAGLRLAITPQVGSFSADEVAVGDSVSISGCCLTVVAIADGALEFEAGEETLSKTILGGLEVGSAVNLERALAVGSRLGGHFVQGHVDGTAITDRIERSDEWIDMWFATPEPLLRLMVPKGSVTVDGVSLTVVHLDAERFSVALIPHTLQVTTLGARAPGQAVNIETDVLGKYVDRLLGGRAPGPYDAGH